MDLSSLLARVDSLRDEISALRPLTDEQTGRAMQRLRMEWTYHSNAIEGNSLTYGETRALLMHGVTAHGKPLKDHLDIRRHRDVIEYLEDFVRSDEPLTLAVVREMHRMLMGDTYEVSAETPDGVRVKREVQGGEFKTLPNNVVTETGETHYYATPEETPARMTDLVDGLPQSGEAHPVVQAALFHHAFVEIHPFPDGNGRTARVLTNLLLMRAGYVPAVIRQEERPAYYGALAAADGGDRQPIVEFVAEELVETMELYLRALKGEPDPSAFDRRIQLLRREVEGIKAQTLFSAEEMARYARELIVPFLEEGDRRAAQISPMFGNVKRITTAVRSGGGGVSGDTAKAAVQEGDAVSFSLMWRFEALKSSPSFEAGCWCRGRFEGGEFVAECLPGDTVFRLAPDQLLGEEDVTAMADATFNPLVEAVEEAVRE